MVERGAPPKIKPLHSRLLKSARGLTTPLLPDDYLALMNPLWSTRELRGTIERIQPETPEASTIVIRPVHEWPGHEPGQYLRIGVEIDGRRHWRAYSLTADPGHPDGLISITVKHVPAGRMSPHFTRRIEPGATVYLGGVEGTFGLPDPLPPKLLFVSAGSGITPIMSMLRELERRGRPRRRRPRPQRALRRERHLRRPARRDGRAPPWLRAPHPLHREQGPPRPSGDSPSSATTGVTATRSPPGPARCSTPSSITGQAEGDPELLDMERFQPIYRSRRRRRGARAARSASASPTSRRPARRRPDPGRRRAGRGRSRLRLPDGDLPHMCRQARRGAGQRSEDRRGERRAGRDDPDLHQRPEGHVEVDL